MKGPYREATGKLEFPDGEERWFHVEPIPFSGGQWRIVEVVNDRGWLRRAPEPKPRPLTPNIWSVLVEWPC